MQSVLKIRRSANKKTIKVALLISFFYKKSQKKLTLARFWY